MLVCGGVEDIFRAEAAEDVLHVCLVGDACHDGMAWDVGELLRHHAPDVVHRRLGLVDEYHLLRLEVCHLAHHLAADAACSTRDEDAARVQLPADGIHVHFNLVAGQEVFDVNLMQLVVVQLALPVPFLCG